MEGVILGRPSVAVSLCAEGRGGVRHNTTAALAALTLLEHVEKTPLPPGVLLNVNVPNDPIKNIKGFKITRRGRREYVDKITCVKDPRGSDAYWITGTIKDEMEEGTDVTAVNDGYVSVTPIRMDMTDYETLDELRSQALDEKLSLALRLR
jgi:5'-nucleotidase